LVSHGSTATGGVSLATLVTGWSQVSGLWPEVSTKPAIDQVSDQMQFLNHKTIAHLGGFLLHQKVRGSYWQHGNYTVSKAITFTGAHIARREYVPTTKLEKEM